MARKLPGGQQVTTWVLVGEEARFAVVRSKLCHNQTKNMAGKVKERDLSNTALGSLSTCAQTWPLPCVIVYDASDVANVVNFFIFKMYNEIFIQCIYIVTYINISEDEISKPIQPAYLIFQKKYFKRPTRKFSRCIWLSFGSDSWRRSHMWRLWLLTLITAVCCVGWTQRALKSQKFESIKEAADTLSTET